MGDTLRPYMFVLLPHPPPPPPPPPSKGTDMPMLYYGLVVVGTAAIVLAIYNLLLLRWCTDHTSRRGIAQQQNPAPRLQGGSSSSSSRSLDNINLITSTFKYKKEGMVGPPERDQGSEYECVVCLSVFEEGEELRQLPTCKHSFHAPCIDMWLYSHLDCPLCRSRVEPPVFRRSPPAVAVAVSSPAMQTGLERPHRASALAEVYLY